MSVLIRVSMVCAKITLIGSHCINDAFLAAQVSAMAIHTCVHIRTQVPAPHRMCASTIDAAIHTTSNLESITNSTQVIQKLFKITEDKRHVSEPPDTVHWSLNHRAASWEKKQGPHVQHRSSIYHTLNNREPRHDYDTSGHSIHIVQLY